MKEDHQRWGKDYGKTEPWPDGEPLSQDEVASLKDGDEVIIRWGGGNGPHKYIITQCGVNEYLYARSTHLNEAWYREHQYKWDNDLFSGLTSYGSENWQTKVWHSNG